MSEGNVSGSTTTERQAGTSLPGQARRQGGEEQPARRDAGLEKRPSGGERELVTPNGRTKIADAVVAKIAGIAAREIGGVHDMGAGMTRTFGSMRERLPGGMGGQNVTQGVAVQVGEEQTAIDIDLIVDYGASIPDLSAAVRDHIIGQVEYMCGLDVVEVNIDVDDIHLPGEEEAEQPQPEQPRVR